MIDYEAAARTLTEYPFDESNDYVQDQARIKAHKAVNAALGDEALYQEANDCQLAKYHWFGEFGKPCA